MQTAGQTNLPSDRGAPTRTEFMGTISSILLHAAGTRLPSHLTNEIYLTVRGAHIFAKQNGAPFSSEARERHLTMVHAFFSILFYLRYKVASVKAVKEKHLIAVTEFVQGNCSQVHIAQSMGSAMKLFCDWIGKRGMVFFRAEGGLFSALNGGASCVTDNLDPETAVGMVRALDEVVAIWVELCLVFDLTPQEAILLDPYSADHGDFLLVGSGAPSRGTRKIKIRNDDQHKIINRAKQALSDKTGLLGDSQISPRRRLHLFYFVVQCSGTTFHELRRRSVGAKGGQMHDGILQIHEICAE